MALLWATVVAGINIRRLTVAAFSGAIRLEGFLGSFAAYGVRWRSGREYVALVQVKSLLYLCALFSCCWLDVIFYRFRGARQGDSILCANAVLLDFF